MAAAKNKRTSESEILYAKKQFFAGLFDMTWRLVAAFFVPVLIGVWIDSRNDGRVFTLVGILIGVVGSVFIIKKVVTDYSKQGGND